MSLLPPTLSNSLRKDLTHCETPAQIVGQLKKKPEKLLLFFQQVCFRHAYLYEQREMMEAIWVEITDLSLSDALSWESVVKTYFAFAKLGSRSPIWPLDLVVRNKSGCLKVSRMVFMQECPLLKERWMRDSQEKKVELSSFAKYLQSLNQLDLIYQLYLTGDFSFLEVLPDDLLCQFIMQSNDWKNAEASKRIQEMMCLRIRSFTTALTMLAFSLTNKLTIIESYCKTLIDNHLFTVRHFDGMEVYMSFFLFITNHPCNLSFNKRDNLQLNESYFLNWNKSVKQPAIILEWFDILISKPGHAFILFRPTESKKEVISASLQANQLGKARFDHDSITNITFNGSTSISEPAIFSMLIICKAINNLTLVDYNNISEDFFSVLADLKPDLKFLNLARCNLSEKQIAQIFKFNLLESLQLVDEKNVTASAFLLVVEHPALKILEIINCRLKLHERLPSINLLSLNLTEVHYSSERELEFLFSACPSLIMLSCHTMPLFKLAHITHPENIESLSIDSCVLELEIVENGSLSTIERFERLKELTLVGIPSGILKSALVSCLSKFKIIIKPSL